MIKNAYHSLLGLAQRFGFAGWNISLESNERQNDKEKQTLAEISETNS